MYQIYFQEVGHFGIEALSRGAKFCVMCDKSNNAIQIINKNVSKTHFEEKAKIIKSDYRKILNIITNYKFDLIFIDPPYNENIAVEAIKEIIEKDILAKEGKIIIETDDAKRELEQLKQIEVNVYDLRKYGRVSLIFLNRKG